MASHGPDWHLYRTFLAVAREGSLSSAARAMGTTQPTMGRQVAALEAALGVKLFTRSPDGLTPTAAGLRLFSSAEIMAGAAEAAVRSASGEADQEKGTVRIAASEVIGGLVLPSMLANFHAAYPGISVELVLSNRNEDLLRGDADLAIRMVRPSQGSLIAKKIGRLDVGLYCHRLYLSLHSMPQRLTDLQQHYLIGYDREQAYARYFEQIGLSLPRDAFVLRSDSEFAQLSALSAGYGIGASQLGIARRNPDLVPVLHSEVIFPMEMWLAMHQDLRGERRIRLAFDHLMKELTQYAKGSQHGA